MIIMKLVFQIGQALFSRSSGNMTQDLEEASHGQTRRSGCQCLRRNLLDERIQPKTTHFLLASSF
jgi:hypothetical protein